MTQAWESVRLEQVLKLDIESVNVEPHLSFEMVGVYSFGRGLFKREAVTGTNTSYKKFYRLKQEHIIMSQLFAWEGALALSNEQFAGLFVSPQFPTFRCDENRLDRQFLGWVMKVPSFWQELGTRAKGMGDRRRTVNPEALFQCPILLPPLEEQRRIVARVESLAAQIAEARGLREQASEKREFLDHRIAARVFDNPLWDRKSVGELCEVRSGIQKSANRLPGANPRRYITVAHVQRNRIETSDPRYFEVNAEEFERWKLVLGDVLVIEGNGSKEHIGRAALFTGQIEDCVHQNHVIRVRPNQKSMQPEFLNAYFNSPVGREQMLERSRTSSGLYTLSTGRIREIIVPLPSLEQQAEVIGILEGYKSQLSSLEQLQEATRLELNALLPSVLSKAFAGQL